MTPDRELDCRIAERLFGWRWGMRCANRALLDPAGRFAGVMIECGKTRYEPHLPSYSSDPAADYLVLEKVRETWSDVMKGRFLNELHRERCERDADYWSLYYLPGDYSRAADAVLRSEG